MGVRITTRDQRIFNEFKNGYSFSNNPLDTTSNLAGSVMENLRAYKLLQVEWFSKSEDTSSSWIVNTSTGSIESNSGNFVTDGFAVDDTFIYEELSSGSGANFTGKITSIGPKLILFTLLTGSRINTDTKAIIRGTTDLSASIFKFGLIGNNENFNIESKVSGNDQAYYAGAIGARPGGPGTPRDTTFVSMSRLGQFKGWQTGGMSIRFVLDNYNASTARTGYQLFEIYHNYTIVPYYLDGQLSDLQNNIIPPLLNGFNSLKYVY